jgi:hypothetical protein
VRAGGHFLEEDFDWFGALGALEGQDAGGLHDRVMV